MRDLARRLLVSSRSASDPHVPEAALVSDRLRIPLTKFAGADGFVSLQRRALVLASEEVPALKSVKVGKGGQLEGLETLAADTGSGGREALRDEAAVAITAHLLELLSTFIGKPFTLRLVREAWPDALLDE